MAVLKCQLSGLCCQRDLCLLRETEHLEGVCEQIARACLMATWTGCMLGIGALCMALRHNWLHHAGLCRAGGGAGTTMFIIITVQFKF